MRYTRPVDKSEIATLAVAIVGAVTGIVALILQAVFFRRSGPRIEANLKWAWINPAGSAWTIAVDQPLVRPPGPRAFLRLAVHVRNRGRAAATVERVEIEIPRLTYGDPAPEVGPGLPLRLEPETSETWYLNPIAVEVARKLEAKPRIRAVVTLGSGTRVRSRSYVLAAALSSVG
jgi:hypothetical protein